MDKQGEKEEKGGNYGLFSLEGNRFKYILIKRVINQQDFYFYEPTLI